MTLLWVLAATVVAAEARPPNIVFFLVDDMGWQDTSVPFHTERTPLNDRFHTPAMERMAAGGMKFTQAYSFTVCTPSRVSWMTGMNVARHRVTNWTHDLEGSQDAKDPKLLPPAWNTGGLSPDTRRAIFVPTAPELLRKAGYRTIHVGKAHFGAVGTPGADPRHLGFDINIGGSAAGNPASYLGTTGFGRGQGLHAVPGLEAYAGQDIFLTEALTREAIKQMDRAVSDGVPFLLYMSHYAVHVPFDIDHRFYDRYLRAGLPPQEAAYASLIEGMDKSLGDLMDELQRLKMETNTVIVFMSDNGGLAAHSRAGPPHTQNAPLSSGKGSAREGGLRVPLMVKWPGVVKGASLCTQYVQIEDLFATFLDLGGVRDGRSTTGAVDSVSMVPLLRGTGDYPKDRVLIWHYPNFWTKERGHGLGPSSAIRDGDWKLIYYHDNQSYELFNLRQDLGEEHNLADSETEIRNRLANELRERLMEAGAQMPIVRATGLPVPWPGLSAAADKTDKDSTP